MCVLPIKDFIICPLYLLQFLYFTCCIISSLKCHIEHIIKSNLHIQLYNWTFPMLLYVTVFFLFFACQFVGILKYILILNTISGGCVGNTFLFTVAWFFTSLFKRFYLFIFNERRMEGEREGEKHRCKKETSIGCLSHAPWWGTTPET